jgi:hypothetical protein
VHKLILSCVVGILVATGTAPASATDVEVFTKFARKFTAADIGLKTRSLCVCQDGSSLNGLGGYVIAKPVTSSITRVQVSCIVPMFANDGTLLNNLICSTFNAVGK